MRRADIDGAYRKCRDPAAASTVVDAISLYGLAGESQTRVALSSRLLALVGRNGAGKTRFLKGLFELMLGRPRSAGSAAIHSAEFRFRGGSHTATATGGYRPPSGLHALYLDVSQSVHAMRSWFEGQANLPELLEQYELSRPSNLVLDSYKHVCRLPYAEFSVREVEGPSGLQSGLGESDDFIFPFFSVVVDGVSYDSLAMGYGELCGCYLVWLLFRASKGSIILLDEPDSSISPLGRRALVDVFALAAENRSLWIGFSSHAAESLEQLLEAEVLYLETRSVNEGIRVALVEQKREAARSLGFRQARRLLLVVEDLDSQELLNVACSSQAPEIAPFIDVQVVGGGAEVISAWVRAFPIGAQACSVLAVLDGDKRDTLSGGDSRILFFPGQSDPIELGRSLITDNASSFSFALGVEEGVMEKAIASSRHCNHHDLLSAITENLGMQSKTVARAREALMSELLRSDGFAEKMNHEVLNPIKRFLDGMPWDLPRR